jgi:RNA polymerase sigma factor (TIGR02999 family)
VTVNSRDKVTMILSDVSIDPSATDELLPLVYEELRRLAQEQLARELPGQTLQPTALVHEAYLRLVADPDLHWDSRSHFYAAAARSMRQILINRAVRRKAMKHGGGRKRCELDDVFSGREPEPDRLLALDASLRRLEELDPRKGRIVMLRYFASLSVEETAKAMDISPATVKRDWQFARTWLHREMTRGEG